MKPIDMCWLSHGECVRAERHFAYALDDMCLKDELDREYQIGGMGLKLTLYYVNEIIDVLQLGLLVKCFLQLKQDLYDYFATSHSTCPLDILA